MVESYERYILSKREKAGFAAGLLLFFSALGYVFYASLFPVILLPVIYKKAETVYCRYLAAKRKNVLLKQFRDLLYSLSASFAAGRHMAEAMEEGRDNLLEVYGEDSLLAGEMGDMLKRIKETGETDIAAWSDFALRSQIEDISDFAAIYAACRETGGNLVLAVNRAASVIGEKITIETEIKTMAAQKKMEGRLITAMPAVIVLFLQLMSPEYLEVMYTTVAGRLLMTVALCAALIAYIVIERITKIEV